MSGKACHHGRHLPGSPEPPSKNPRQVPPIPASESVSPFGSSLPVQSASGRSMPHHTDLQMFTWGRPRPVTDFEAGIGGTLLRVRWYKYRRTRVRLPLTLRVAPSARLQPRLRAALHGSMPPSLVLLMLSAAAWLGLLWHRGSRAEVGLSDRDRLGFLQSSSQQNAKGSQVVASSVAKSNR